MRRILAAAVDLRHGISTLDNYTAFCTSPLCMQTPRRYRTHTLFVSRLEGILLLLLLRPSLALSRHSHLSKPDKSETTMHAHKFITKLPIILPSMYLPSSLSTNSQGSTVQASLERVEVVTFFFRRLTDRENFHKITSQVCRRCHMC